MKSATFKKVKIEIEAYFFGSYILTAKYNGRMVCACTSNDDCFIWLNNKSDKNKNYEAKLYAYNRILEVYDEYAKKNYNPL
jgi:hypothetical protein